MTGWNFDIGAALPEKPRVRVKAGSRQIEQNSHSAARNGANTENDHVDGSAPRAGHAGQSVNALPGQVESQNRCVSTFDGNASLAAREGEKPLHSNSNPQPSSSTDADKAGMEPPPSMPAAQFKPLRPHCLNPGLCAGSGREHCHSCKKAMAQGEAA